MSGEGWPDKIILFPTLERLSKAAHFLLDQFQHETPSEYPKHPPVPVLKGELKFPYGSEGNYLD